MWSHILKVCLTARNTRFSFIIVLEGFHILHNANLWCVDYLEGLVKTDFIRVF